MDIIDRINELIAEAEKEPSWTAVQALRCLRKELMQEKELNPCEKCQEWECDGCPYAYD